MFFQHIPVLKPLCTKASAQIEVYVWKEIVIIPRSLSFRQSGSFFGCHFIGIRGNADSW